MSNNDRQGRQLLGANAPGEGDASSLLDAIFGLTQGGARPPLGEGGLRTGEASRGLLPFPQQGLSADLTEGRATLPGYQNPLTLSDIANLPNFPAQQAPPPPFNPFNLNTPLESPGRGLSAPRANTPPVFSTSLPSLASPQPNPTNSKLNNLRLAIATRDPNESVEDVLSPRSLSFLHSHFQSMGVNLPAAASWGQIQQLLGQPQTPRSNLQGSSSSLFSDRGGSLGGGLPQQDSAASPFQPQESFQWNPAPAEAGESVLDRFLASVNLPPTETNQRITKLAANLILQQQQQQQEQQRLLRQHQIRQLQESFQLQTQIPPLPTFQQQPLQNPSFGNTMLGAGLTSASPPPPPTSSPFPSLPKLNPQMTELWQAAFSKENQGGMSSFLNTQKFAAAASQRPKGGQRSPRYSVPQQVAQVFVGQQPSPQQPQGFSVAQGIMEQRGPQNLMSLVAPLTSDAMRRAVMAGGPLSAQPAQEPSMATSLSQGSGRTGKRAFRTEGPYQPETSLEEASAESTPVERKRPRQVNSPQASSRVSFGAIPRAPTFNNRFSQVTIPPLPPTPSLQFLNQAPPLAPGIARPAKVPGGGLAAYSFPAGGSLQSEEKGGGKGIGLSVEADKARGETPVKLNRAKRGQATDPHSVAERIRRDKITEKMKQLESLVPHRHKKDKASMLEEIIEYVKFMQLQVQVLSIGTQEKAQPLREALPGGLPEAAVRGGGGILPGMGGSTAAAAAPQVASQLQRSPEQAVRFLLERGLCLVPAHLAAKLVETPPEVLKQGADPLPTAPQPRPSTASLLASPLTAFPSETEGARPPSTVFSDWEEEENRAAERVGNKMRDDDAREVAEALHQQEQETRSGSGIASSAGLAVGAAFGRPQGEEEQGVDQFSKIDAGQDFAAMSPGLGEGLDLRAFEKGEPSDEEGHMATMWDSDLQG